MKDLVLESARPSTSSAAGQYLIFALGSEQFALSIQQVREIIEYDNVTGVPMMPAFVKGIINLRGRVVPVIDLASRFGREAGVIHRRTCIVITEVEHEGSLQELGVVVDSVTEVLEIGADDIEPAPSFGAKIRSDFITGMGKVKGRFVILLNAAKVLAMDEMASLAEMNGNGRALDA